MSPKHRAPEGPLAGFKQVSKRPPRFECEFCGTAGGSQGFVMDRNAMVLHSKMAEHKRKEKEHCPEPEAEEGGWTNWNAGAEERGGGGGVGYGWGDADDEGHNEAQRWEPTEEESERWQYADEKAERIKQWVDAVNVCREQLQEDRRMRTREYKAPGGRR